MIFIRFFWSLNWIFCGLVFCDSICSFISAQTKKRWSTLYKYKLDYPHAQEYRNKKQLIFSKYDTMPFTQLIFSWNAISQEYGYLAFEVMVRDGKTQKWDRWIEMVHWGKNKAESFYAPHEKASGFYHVRLEMPEGTKADAFKIRVSAVSGGSISCLRALYVSTIDFSQFVSELGDMRFGNLASVMVFGIPGYSQMTLNHNDAERMCSPTASSMLISYMCKKPIEPLHFALKVYDRALDTYGNWIFNAARAFEQCSTMYIHVERLNSFIDLYRNLKLNIPIVVSIRGPIAGGFREYQSGHLVLVVGYDAKNKMVVCNLFSSKRR